MITKLIFPLCLLTFSVAAALTARAQVQAYRQANNAFEFIHDLNEKWVLQFDAGQSWTSKPSDQNTLHSLSQLYGRAWAHYLPNDKWKLSFFYAYYYNKYLPEINQREAPEWRSAVQAIYYITRNRFTISARGRFEDRHIYNTDSVYEAVERFRSQIKVVYPINGQAIARHVFYGITSEELIFKTKSKVSGPDLFDRNKFIIGLGYGVTKNLQIELTYANEFLPRTPVSDSYNELQLNLVFYNVLPRLNKFLFKEKKHEAGAGD